MFFHLIFFLVFRTIYSPIFVFLVRIRILVFRYDFVSLENNPFLPYFGHFDAFRSFRSSMRIIQALSARNHPSVALIFYFGLSLFLYSFSLLVPAAFTLLCYVFRLSRCRSYLFRVCCLLPPSFIYKYGLSHSAHILVVLFISSLFLYFYFDSESPILTCIYLYLQYSLAC